MQGKVTRTSERLMLILPVGYIYLRERQGRLSRTSVPRSVWRSLLQPSVLWTSTIVGTRGSAWGDIRFFTAFIPWNIHSDMEWFLWCLFYRSYLICVVYWPIFFRVALLFPWHCRINATGTKPQQYTTTQSTNCVCSKPWDTAKLGIA